MYYVQVVQVVGLCHRYTTSVSPDMENKGSVVFDMSELIVHTIATVLDDKLIQIGKTPNDVKPTPRPCQKGKLPSEAVHTTQVASNKLIKVFICVEH